MPPAVRRVDANEVQKNVSLKRPFYLATTEISNQQFRRWRDHYSAALGGKTLDMDNQPAVNLLAGCCAVLQLAERTARVKSLLSSDRWSCIWL